METLTRKLMMSCVVLAGLASTAQAQELGFAPASPIEGDTVWLTYADKIAAHVTGGECRTTHRLVRSGRTLRVVTFVHGVCAASALTEVQLLGKLPAGDDHVVAGGVRRVLHVRPANTDPGELTRLQKVQLAVAQA